MLAPVKAAPIMQAAALSVVINEVAWGGTSAANSDEWIELYNPTSNIIDLSGWTITVADAIPTPITIPSGSIPAGGYFLLERVDKAVNDISADYIYGGANLGNNPAGETLTLYDNTVPAPNVIDTVNLNGGAWPGGSGSPNHASMERINMGVDSDSIWGSNNGVTVNGLDANGAALRATPKQQNSIYALPTSTPTITNTPTDTGTPTTTGTTTATPTTTNTPTTTSTPTITVTPTITLAPAAGIVISEFRTRGTGGANDEFIELYNPTSGTIDISGWTISRSSSCGTSTTTIVTILTVTLAAGRHYLIGGTSYTGSVTPDQANVSLNIANDGGIALLNGATFIDRVGLCASTLYLEGTALSQLTSDANRSYDRKSTALGSCVDSNNNAADFILRTPSDPQNSSSPLTVCGNPTPTPTATPPRTATPRPSPTRTPTPLPPPELVAINEFVPRPGHDWNNDGAVNVGDEFIEIINHGTISVSLNGYSLDDEVNIGSTPFSLPSVTLSPGERIVFYGKETGLLLSDGGDGVRLLRPNGQLVDAFNYTVVNYPDQSYCRLPDNGGLDDWNRNCFPTPGLRNTLSGNFVSPLGRGEELLCPIADTLPFGFFLAECDPFGHNIWRPAYWDDTGWYGEQDLPEQPGKWNIFVD